MAGGARSPTEHGPGRGLLALSCATALVDSLLITALPPLIPHYERAFHLDSASVGVLVAGYSIGLLIGALPAGYLTARHGPRRVALAALASLALSGVLFAFATSFPDALAARIVGGTSSAFSWTSVLTWVIDRSSPGRRDHVSGVIYGAGFAGVTLGPVLGALAAQVGTETVFTAFAIGVAVLILPVALARDQHAAPGARTGGFLALARSSSVAVALTLQALPGFLTGALGLLLTLQLAGLGAGPRGIAAVFLVAALVQGMSSVLIGRWSAVRGARGPALAAALAAAGLTAIVIALPTVWLVSAAAVGIYAAAAVLLVAGTSLLGTAMASSGHAPAFGYALMNLAFAPGSIVGSLAAGTIRQDAGQAPALVMVSLVCLCTAIPLVGGLRARAVRVGR